jgi:hypothetical protein
MTKGSRYPSREKPWVRTSERRNASEPAARAAAEAKRAEAERMAIAEAEKIVAIWNARQAGGRALWFYPTIGAAIAAGLPWLERSPARRAGKFGSVDLRTAARFPASSRWCRAGGVHRTPRSRGSKC